MTHLYKLIQRLLILLLKLGLYLDHVHFRARHHQPDQRSVVSARALKSRS